MLFVKLESIVGTDVIVCKALKLERVVAVHWCWVSFVKCGELSRHWFVEVRGLKFFCLVELWRNAGLKNPDVELRADVEALFRSLGEAELAMPRLGGTPC